MLTGIFERQLWLQFFVFVSTVYLIVEMSNSNALLRIRSRMVSCSFLALSCTVSFLFEYPETQIISLCFTLTCSLLFMSYQDETAVGKTYYAFLFIGVASLAFPKIIYLVPLLWLSMALHIQTISLRTLSASLLGLLTPYWFLGAWLIVKQDFSLLNDLLSRLTYFDFPTNYSNLSLGNILTFAFVVVLMSIGIINFWHHSFEDKIKIRQIYGFFTVIGVFCAIWLTIEPYCYTSLMPIIIICTSPLIGHYFVHTSTRLSNISFFLIVGLATILTIFNLWTPSLSF